MSLDRSLKADIEKALVVERSPANITPSSATVSVSIQNYCIPFETLPHVNIRQVIFENFHAILDSKELPAEGIPDIVSYLVKTDKLMTFRGGYVESEDGHTISLSLISIGSQSLIATVWGTSRQALYVCKKLGEILWTAVGRPTRWSELSSGVVLVSYSTTTQVDLGRPIKSLLSQPFIDFLDQDLIESSLAVKMGQIGAFSVSHKEHKMNIVTSVPSLDINVSVFDEISGKQEEMRIAMIDDTRLGANRNDIKIASELSFEDHVRLIETLLIRIPKIGSKS